MQLVKLDMTDNKQLYFDDLARSEMHNIPLNLIYPADYPESPAIMLPEFISPAVALEALNRIAPETEQQEESADNKAEAARDSDDDTAHAG